MNILPWLSAGDPRSTRRLQLETVCVLLLVLIVAAYVVSEVMQRRIEEQRNQAGEVVRGYAERLRLNLNHALSSTSALAALVRQGNGEVPHFDAVSRQLVDLYPGIGAVQLAPGGIVRRSYPHKGHERAIGHDLLADPQRDKEAFLARDTGKLTLAGPFNLVQGGLGAVGRLPIFLPDSQGQPAFWGFATVLLRFPDFLDATMPQDKHEGYHWVLWRTHPDTGKRQVIAVSGPEDLIDPVDVAMPVPNGHWAFSVVPAAGWGDPTLLREAAALGLFVSLLLTILFALVRRNPLILHAEMDRRSRELAYRHALFGGLFDQSVFLAGVLDGTGHLLEINETALAVIGQCRESVVGQYFPDTPWWSRAEDRATLKGILEAAAAGAPGSFEAAHPALHGGEIVVLFHALPVRAGEETYIAVTGVDITERKKAEEKLHLAASVFTHAREGIMITDAAGNIVDVNDTFSGITGYRLEEVIGQNPRILSSGRQDKAFYAAMWGDLIEKGHWCGEIWNRRKSGEIYAEMLTISAVHDVNGGVQNYVALFSDITVQKEYEVQLAHNAHYDALTGLPNRVLLADRLHQAMVQAQRRKQRVAVAYLDLDGFKAINDRHGHGAGDQLLIIAATRMRESLREGDTLARLGGDEFVAVLLDVADIDDSASMLVRLLDSASQPVQVGDLVLQVSASIGVTFYPQADVDADQLLRQADQAMYQAKLAGKNRYYVFDSERDHSIRGRHESLERIRLALAKGEFVLHYQPKVNMRSGTVIGAEALVRWQCPERGLLSPAVFLPVIEDHPLAIEVGEWVIDGALTQMENWHAAGLDIPVSINIGARQLQQANFVQRLREILGKHPDIKASRLELEVLETSALEDLAHVSQVIAACQKLGVSFALDDFGTGYSSLTYLKRLPVALLKIDQTFVRDMLDDPNDLSILEGVLSLAMAFNRQVIAEGVETLEHGAMLLQLGCELGQGYGIARPMPADNIPAWAAAWHSDPSWRNLPALPRTDLPLLCAGVEYRAWIRAIESHLMGEREAPSPLDIHQCRFGRWMESEGLTRYSVQPAFLAIGQLRRQVHALAAELIDLQAAGRDTEARGRLTELHGLNDALVEQLKVLVRENTPL